MDLAAAPPLPGVCGVTGAQYRVLLFGEREDYPSQAATETVADTVATIRLDRLV